MSLIGLIISTILILILFIVTNFTQKKGQIKTYFSNTLICLLICCIGLVLQILFNNINPLYFDYFVYIGTCFLPVFFLLFSICFTKTKFKFNKKYLLLFIVPITSLIVLWTNHFHHLFYKVYSTNFADTVYGTYFYFVHSLYTYLLFFVGLINLIRYSIKNAGFFSKQSLLVVGGSIICILINILGTFGIIKMSIYVTPISFTLAMIFYALAIFKFDFLKVTPIALQRVVDRMSDRICYY